MSLKTFHIVFISIATLFCLGFGVWCLSVAAMRMLGACSLAVAVALVVYEVLFLKKFKKISFQ